MSKNEPLNSPFSRLYLCPETKSDDIMNCALGFKYPIDVQALKEALLNSLMLKHPRFCSLLVRNPNGSGEHWKPTLVNLDDHVILHHHDNDNDNDDGGGEAEEEEEEEAAVNAYLADISVSTPLSENKPLWEVHVLLGLKCVVLRVHHTLGDAVSLMSMLSACFGKNKEMKSSDHNVKNHNQANKDWRGGGIFGLIKSLWFTFIFGMRLLGRIMWVKEKISVLSGGDGVELWPRKIVTAKFKIQDFKSIKLAIPSVTINDVLLGVISHGLSKYVDATSPNAPQQELRQVTAILVFNLRENSSLQEKTDLMRVSTNGFSGWGNKTGIVLLPNYCCNGPHPFDHVRAMKATMDQKKQSYEALISHFTLKLLTSYISPKVGSWVYQRILCKTTLLISNIMGPSEEIVIAGNPVTNIRLNISSQPHAITLHMVSYAGNADLQVLVAKDIIPDPEVLVNCFYDSLLEMKNCIKI
ncbi:wax ester synthase/diacylglycerol acyltransferase 11-like [Spinacia oleracea]|uniref:Wax ester synthase/diacylglycerol acyltransferase 11-like n=1 Tax=Spinacia oleracea TaxID=3562 RepID=A0A9R0I4Q3_SPIOL|nr:wax ester synthase/diacylglycerol acyltransferase 11-like [Spinacia oleracea]